MRIQLSIRKGDLVAIDKAAKVVGENRSEYMARAALDRAGAVGSSLTKAQEQAVMRIVKEGK